MSDEIRRPADFRSSGAAEAHIRQCQERLKSAFDYVRGNVGDLVLEGNPHKSLLDPNGKYARQSVRDSLDDIRVEGVHACYELIQSQNELFDASLARYKSLRGMFGFLSNRAFRNAGYKILDDLSAENDRLNTVAGFNAVYNSKIHSSALLQGAPKTDPVDRQRRILLERRENQVGKFLYETNYDWADGQLNLLACIKMPEIFDRDSTRVINSLGQTCRHMQEWVSLEIRNMYYGYAVSGRRGDAHYWKKIQEVGAEFHYVDQALDSLANIHNNCHKIGAVADMVIRQAERKKTGDNNTAIIPFHPR